VQADADRHQERDALAAPAAALEPAVDPGKHEISEHGAELDKAGVKIIGPGDVTDDDLLNGMGDVVLGTVTAHFYSAAHPSEKNKAFVEAFRKANNFRPNFMAVGGYDGMHLIYEALRSTATSRAT
jgi:ABC-type branched-subunit amino acid transport system substrate-binding protein